MAVKKRLRGVAKLIRGDARFKRMIADYIVDMVLKSSKPDIRDILMNGCRGYMAMSEKALCDLFDNVVLKITSGEMKLPDPPYQWGQKEADYRCGSDIALARAESIYTEIFERYVLRDAKEQEHIKQRNEDIDVRKVLDEYEDLPR